MYGLEQNKLDVNVYIIADRPPFVKKKETEETTNTGQIWQLGGETKGRAEITQSLQREIRNDSLCRERFLYVQRLPGSTEIVRDHRESHDHVALSAGMQFGVMVRVSD